MLFDTDDNYVTLELTDEGGITRPYELLDTVEYESTAYGVFMPIEQPEGEVVILRLAGNDAQKADGYVPVNNEGVEQAVFDIFQIKNMDAFDFGGNSFQNNDLL